MSSDGGMRTKSSRAFEEKIQAQRGFQPQRSLFMNPQQEIQTGERNLATANLEDLPRATQNPTSSQVKMQNFA